MYLVVFSFGRVFFRNIFFKKYLFKIYNLGSCPWQAITIIFVAWPEKIL